MAVNITFTGNIYNAAETKFFGSEVSYQAYFRQVNGSSSPSIWSDPRTSILGQYNFNLADTDLLGTGGNAGDNDIVVIVFWHPGTDRNVNCSTLIEWSVFEIVLGIGPGMSSSALYVNGVQIKSNIVPDLNWSLPPTGYVDTSYTAINTSEDEHSWVWSGTTMYHWYTRYGQTINNVNQVNNSDYFWGDTNSDLNLPGAANGTHQWDSAGTYDVNLVIEDECSATVTGTKQIQIFNHAPECGIKCNQAVGQNIITPDAAVTFEYDGVDIDDKIQYINWKINDSGAYGDTDTTVTGTNKTNTILHGNGLGTDWCSHVATSGAFTNPGNHLIEIWIKWWDGFATQTVYCSETFIQQKFGAPTIDFTQVPPQAILAGDLKFVNASTDVDRIGLGLPNCDEYEWTWTENGVPTVYSDKPYDYELEVVPGFVDCEVKFCADYSDGWDTHTVCEEKNVVFATIVTITEEDCYYNLNIVGTSSDGTISGYSWTVASGISETGPWVETWSSPTGLEQNDKKVCFTNIGWYQITGYVYGSGSTTSDDETICITIVCPTIAVCEPKLTASQEGALHTRPMEMDGPNLIASRGGQLHVRIGE